MDRHDTAPKGTKYLTFDRTEDVGSNPTANPAIGDVIAARFGRRGMLRGMLALGATTALSGTALTALTGKAEAAAALPPFTFKEIEHGVDETHHVAEGYNADILIRWGDPVVPGAPAFDPGKQTAAAQAQQFGYNNDFVGFAPLPLGSNTPDHGLLCVNHEYTDEEVMFPGVGVEQQKDKFARMTKDLVDIEIAAHGGSVIEIRKVDGTWAYDPKSTYNRRITGETECTITGPAAGHALLKTGADATGTTVRGMLNNCSGGMTPWGTWLSAEENTNGYFWGKTADENSLDGKAKKRYGIPGGWYNWGQYHDRFDVAKEPNECNRFGWIVEIDPYDPNAVPKKRTAFGRFKHEACTIVVEKDGTVVAYSGDDERFDYVYKLVAKKKYDPNNRAANLDILEDGTLFVAKFNADGSVEWLPLVHGQGPLTADKGFADQATVLVYARLAADALGATKMDRPEDIEYNPVTGKVVVVLTNNSRRKADQVDAANPRPENQWGHIIEISADGSHAAPKATWELLLKAGNPADPAIQAQYHPETTANGWFACPDNVACDHQGRLWVATDQGEAWAKASGSSDGIWAVETEGPRRGLSKMFFRVPVGAEMCGPWFTPDDKTFFVAVQHPATDGVDAWPKFGKLSSFEDPATRWPDFKDGMPPRPSVVVITKKDGGVIGS